MAIVSSTQTPSHNTPQRFAPGSLRMLLPVTYLALVLLSVGGLILWAGLQMQATAFAQAGNDLELQARLIASGIEEPLTRWEELEHDDDEEEKEGEEEEEDEEEYIAIPQIVPPDSTLIRLVSSAAESIGGRVTLTDARQRVVYSSDAAVPVGTTLPSPEFSTQARDIRTDEWTQEQRLFIATPIVQVGGRLSGYVQLSIPTTRIQQQIAQTWTGLLLAGGAVVLLTTMVSLGMAHFILHPIQAVTQSAGAIANGDLMQQVHPTGPEEIRQLAEAFNQMTARLRDLLGRQRDFVAHAAHELRTPLTALCLRLEIIQAHRQDNPELVAHYLDQMGTEIEHLRRLVDHLLALAALDAQELPPRTPLDLAPLLYQLADDLGPLVQAAEHTLRVEVPPHLPLVPANADQMQAVIRNLLDNAIKYTPTGGVITLSAVAMPQEIQIAVSDTGIGIPPEALPRIFDRFYRVDKARSRKSGGAGLGLTLVKEVAEAYGGQIEVQSQVEQGSSFILHLPLG